MYDLLLHNYGPDKFLGSLHVEVDENMTAREIDFMSRCTSCAAERLTLAVTALVGVLSAYLLAKASGKKKRKGS